MQKIPLSNDKLVTETSYLLLRSKIRVLQFFLTQQTILSVQTFRNHCILVVVAAKVTSGSLSTNATDLECPLGQDLSTLPSPPVGQALKQRFVSLVINTLLLHQRKTGWCVLGLWVAMISRQEMPCLAKEEKLIFSHFVQSQNSKR